MEKFLEDVLWWNEIRVWAVFRLQKKLEERPFILKVYWEKKGRVKFMKKVFELQGVHFLHCLLGSGGSS